MNFDHYQFEIGINLQPEAGELTVLFSGEGSPKPGHKVGPSVHDYYLIHTVLSGQGVFVSEGHAYLCQAGDTFMISPGKLFSYESDRRTPWHYVWVAVQGEHALRLLKEAGLRPEKPVLQGADPAALHSLYQKIRLSFKQSPYPGLESLEASGWLRLLFHRLGLASRNLENASARQPEMIDRQVEQAIRWITLQYHQQLGIGQIASALGYHRAHFSKAFKERTGLSPKQYLMKIRMDKAKELLASRALTIDEVSSSVGFNDALYFSKQFRSWFGQSPSEYRSGLKPL
ncbi:helix-turn-helix transcriptional regulator [Paenibacillus rhizophilus]|uniref:AraC family transcriptional regulator n=1 Tax=Paenibacillus rhizophilus TaxID=1850366 RepID=A0A3N9PBI4_9BACL|nr:AraC family transcriptional regulator [Paenibacillus rhizophilus]RQW13601.1 AraC family transcriptional regulator [Paenibacillus rhizophilus]